MPKLVQVAAFTVAVFAGLILWQRLAAGPAAAGNEALEAKVAELEAKVEVLDDTRQIERLQRVYGYYLDKKLWDEIIPLFTEDARVEIGGRGVYVGRTSVAHLFKDVMGGGKEGLEYGTLHNHMQLQGVVDVDPGGKAAKGRWRAFMQVAALNRTALWAEGPYEIEYAKLNGKWMFRKMRWYPTYYVPYDKGWDKPEAQRGGASMAVNKQYPPDLPPSGDARPFPEVSVPPFHYENPITGK
ncbi:MAG TPA: nuclear transport factor 2 family protein [Bryobacteraceae bacterium]|nr:nuclear transport factor 2 family protein [Bryobacteraceae bacterium]